MRYTFFIPIFIIASSCLPVKTKVESDKPTTIHEDTMLIIEKQLFMSCPISKGPTQVISYLEGVPSFIRNKEYDYGNGSVRFNAKNASFFDAELIDDKSLFLLNYNTANGDYKFFLFQAIYFFKNNNDMEYHLERILDLLKNGLKLQSTTMYDALKNPYSRFYLPDGSGFNLKHSPEESEKHIIDIIWVPDATK